MRRYDEVLLCCFLLLLLFRCLLLPSFVSSPFFVDKFKIIHSRKNPKFDVLSFLLFYLLFRPFHLQSNKAILIKRRCRRSSYYPESSPAHYNHNLGRSRSIQIYCRVDIPLITSSLVVLTVCTANVQVLLANNNTKSAGRTTDKDGADSVKILPKVQRFYETYRCTNPNPNPDSLQSNLQYQLSR